MEYNIFLNDILSKLNKINTFAGKIRFASEMLTRIGSGSGRIVYDIDGEKVLKLAKNVKGIAQNEVEANVGRNLDTQHIVAKIFDEADDNSWLISEKAKKVTEKRIKDLTGIPNLFILYKYLTNAVANNSGKRNNYSIEPEIIDKLNDNEFVQELFSLIFNYNQKSGDYNRPSSFGEVLRDGKPTIVLVDYGLNDEVYDTHYSPDRRQKLQMYEMYNFADGNDDILSDIGNTGEVRHDMWALIPQDIDNDNGIVNEKFISFIENRNSYPSKPISNLPILIDHFHECINSLKEYINKANDKKKFYINLLILQEYLISHGGYDRDKLLLEEQLVNKLNVVDTPPIVWMSLDDKAYAEQIANEVANKLEFSVKYIGEGSNGFAFLTSNNTVFKITADISEADAASKLMKVNPVTIIQIYSIYKIVDTEKNLSFIGLIEEYIENKPVELFKKYNEIINTILPNGLSRGKIMGLMKNKISESFDYNGMVEIAQKLFTDNPNANISKADRRNTYNYLIGIFNIKKELLEYNIKSNDFSNVNNIGYKNNVLILFDFGGYHGVDQGNIPFNEKDVIFLPENNENLFENESTFKLNRNSADIIANGVSKNMKFGQPKYFGEGEHGYAYDINDNRIMKITSDKSEAVESLKIKGKQLKYLADIYGVFEASPKDEQTNPNVYIIISEKLETNQQYFDKMVDRLDYIFEKLFNTDFYHILDDYVYDRYDEYNNKKNIIDRYLVKNIEDAKYYYGILAIADEAHKYGIESLDYYNTGNLGYKPNGNLGFFDMGWGDDSFNSNRQPEKVDIEEDGNSLFSQTNSIGHDDFPIYDNNDSSPLTDNNVPTDQEVHEDLEYNHVTGDSTSDEYRLTEDAVNELIERILSSMKGSSLVNIKKKCRLGGNGSTSTACNQGDLNNLDIKKL